MSYQNKVRDAEIHNGHYAHRKHLMRGLPLSNRFTDETRERIRKAQAEREFKQATKEPYDE